MDCTRNAAGGVMGCVGRAFQALYFKRAELLVLHCHAPNVGLAGRGSHSSIFQPNLSRF